MTTDWCGANRSVTVAAPAKINLALDLLGERDDGYTEIATVFQTVEFGDTVEIMLESAQKEVLLEVVGESPSRPDDNLAVRAARAYCASAGLEPRLRIKLTKRIPMGAGLGGGSSDAAAVLDGLDWLSGEIVPKSRQLELAAGLGADVPFFMLGGLALGRGRGDRLTPLDDIPELAVVLARMGPPLETAAVYGHARRRLTPREVPPNIQRFLGHLQDGSTCLPPLGNDLLESACSLRPEIGLLLERLAAAGGQAGMTGSGSAVFGLFQCVDTARQAAERLAVDEPSAWLEVTRTTCRSRHGASVILGER